MKTVLLCRVSSKEQEETGYSLPAQEKFLREYGEKQGLEISKVFAISESAAGKTQRKVFLEMLGYVRKKNICAIIVETTDRLTRNFSDVPTIDLWITESEEHQIHLAKEACILHNSSRSHEWFMWRVKVATAEYYVRLLSENVKKGQKEKLAQGWIPTKPPLGYKTVGETGHKIHVVDEGASKLVIKMFELYASGDYSIKKLANTMYDEGMRSPMGNRLAISRTHSLLRDPFYMGKMRWNDEIHDGKHQPLISKELFDKVQKMLVSKTTPKYMKHDYLFKGLLRCAGCDGLITWELHRGHHYGHCNHYHDCTQETWVREEKVEEQIIDGFDQLMIKNKHVAEWIKKALKESHADETVYHSTTVDELNKRYEQIKKRIDKLYDDKLDEKITLDFYNQKFKQYTGEKDAVLDTIKKHSQASNGYFNFGINFYELSQRAKQVYLTAKEKGLVEEQRCLIRLIFTNLKLDEGKLLYDYTAAFKILAQAVKDTNCSKVDKMDKFDDKSFEHRKKSDVTGQKGFLLPSRPIWLPRLDSNQGHPRYKDPSVTKRFGLSHPHS